MIRISIRSDPATEFLTDRIYNVNNLLFESLSIWFTLGYFMFFRKIKLAD